MLTENNYGSKIEVIVEKIALKNIFDTKMFCKDSYIAEPAYLNTINQVNKANLANSKLALLKVKAVLLVFKKAN